MRRRGVAGVALVLWAGVSAGFAAADDPGKGVFGWLETRPLTLMDHGLAALGAELQAVAAEWGPDLQAAAAYDRAAGRIVLSFHDWTEEALTDSAGCQEVLDMVRLAAGIDPDSGLPLDGTSTYASAFAPPGGDQTGAPEGWLAALDRKFKLVVILGPGDRAVRCSGPLLAPGAS
ncbi:MAG: hypothetical protein HQ481_17550 [Alphaproteobacteria bacterium]|nr:hypothetical protein [Alphaproteobacteria bacterium]